MLKSKCPCTLAKEWLTPLGNVLGLANTSYLTMGVSNWMINFVMFFKGQSAKPLLPLSIKTILSSSIEF